MSTDDFAGLIPLMDDDYQTSAQGYLARCRDRLLEGTKQGIFYAAVELRCCVKARLAQYFEHHEPLSGTKFQPWRLGESQKAVRKITTGDTISQITFSRVGGKSIKQFHTPIPMKLENYVKRSADGLRHCQDSYRAPDDPWWAKTRLELVEAYRAAWVACRGELPIPPLWNSESGDMFPITISNTEENRADLDALEIVEGTRMNISVEHLHSPPADWVCDL